jgi:hypothetical protein
MAMPAAVRLALPLLCALSGCDDASDPWRELVADQVTTTGRVSHIDCDDVRYAFQAGARTYAAQDPDGVLDCRTVRIGDPVLVYYAPQDPGKSTLLPPAEARARALRWTLAGDAWLALVGAAAVVLSLAAKLWAARRSLA